jgi:hypothetical protein
MLEERPMSRLCSGLFVALFAISSLSVANAAELPDQLLRQMAQDSKNIKQCVASIGLAKTKAYLSAKLFPLSTNGNEILIEVTQSPEACGLCGNRRCDQWVYQKTQNGFALLLNIEGADEVVALSSTTKGRHDLKVVYPAGNTYPESYEFFAFDGKRYRKK